MSFQYDSDRKGTIIAEEYIDGLIKHSFTLIKKQQFQFHSFQPKPLI